MTNEIHIPYLTEDERLYLNTAAVYSQKRRTNNTMDSYSRSSIETNASSYRQQSNPRRHLSISSLSFLWKRRESTSSYSIPSLEYSLSTHSSLDLECDSISPKAKELESLIFDQPQRTVRISLTPHCAI